MSGLHVCCGLLLSSAHLFLGLSPPCWLLPCWLWTHPDRLCRCTCYVLLPALAALLTAMPVGPFTALFLCSCMWRFRPPAPRAPAACACCKPKLMKVGPAKYARQCSMGVFCSETPRLHFSSALTEWAAGIPSIGIRMPNVLKAQAATTPPRRRRRRPTSAAAATPKHGRCSIDATRTCNELYCLYLLSRMVAESLQRVWRTRINCQVEIGTLRLAGIERSINLKVTCVAVCLKCLLLAFRGPLRAWLHVDGGRRPQGSTRTVRP